MDFTVSFLCVCSGGALTAAVLLHCRTDERLHFAACDKELPSVGNVPGLAVAFLQGNSLKTLHEKEVSRLGKCGAMWPIGEKSVVELVCLPFNHFIKTINLPLASISEIIVVHSLYEQRF